MKTASTGLPIQSLGSLASLSPFPHDYYCLGIHGNEARDS